MAKRGRRLSTVTVGRASKLFKIEGTEEILEKITSLRNIARLREIKEVFALASIPVWSQAKRNVATLPAGQRLKEILDAGVIINKGEERKSNALVGVSQEASMKKLNRKQRFVANPYWFEFGTAMRKTKQGKSTGAIPATPFFRPAVAAKKAEVRNALEVGILRIIEDEASK